MSSTWKKSGQTLLCTAAIALLAACGGGGDAPPVIEPPVSQPPVDDKPAPPVAIVCPDHYRTTTLQNSSVGGINFTLAEGNASFKFKFPNDGKSTSAKLCLGKPSEPLAQDGYQVLSDTYEALVQPLGESTDPKMDQIERSLSIKFALSGLPEGTTTADMAEKIRIYSPDSAGAWQVVPDATIDIVESEDPAAADSLVTAVPAESGKFVVAFKP